MKKWREKKLKNANDIDEKLSADYDIPIAKVSQLKKVRNEYMGSLNDDELMIFHIEWTKVCNLLKGGKRNAKRI